MYLKTGIQFDAASTTTNTATGETLSLEGFQASPTLFEASRNDTTLMGGPRDEALIYDLTFGGENALRFSGFDRIDMGAGDDIVDFTVSAANADQPYGYDQDGYGDDLAGAFSATVTGGLGDDTIWGGGAGVRTFHGDRTTFKEANGTLVVGGNDTIDLSGTTGPVSATGEGRYLGLKSGSTVVAGDDHIVGGDGGNHLGGDSVILGYLGRSTVTGGDDTLLGGRGDDELVGDADQIAYVSVFVTCGADRLSGGAGNDSLYGDGQQVGFGSGNSLVIAGADHLVGGAGDDWLHGEGYVLADAPSTFAQGERFTVTGGADTLLGGTGGDHLFGEGHTLGFANYTSVTGGADHLVGGAGDDWLYGEGYLILPEINEDIGGFGSTVTGGADTLRGGDGNDHLYGEGYEVGLSSRQSVTCGADRLVGDAGDDWLSGDGYRFGAGNQSTVTGGADTVGGGVGNDTLLGDGFSLGSSAPSSSTTGGDDRLVGGEGDDQLFGDGQSFLGGAGSSVTGGEDTLLGGLGDDTLVGDALSFGTLATASGGDDTFVFAPGGGRDEISDFGTVEGSRTGDDLIDVSAYGIASFGALSLSGNGTAAVTITFGADEGVIVRAYDGSALTLATSDFIFA